MINLRSELYSAFYDTDPSPITAFVQWVVTSYKVTDSPHILDIGCGPGRMLPEFARLGWSVVGRDPDPGYVAHATQVAEAFDNVIVQTGGFADIQDVERFDVVAAINGPFSCLLGVEERVDALRRMFRALKPGGVLFLDMANFLWILKYYREPQERTTTVNERVVTLMTQHTLDFHGGILTHVDEFSWEDPQEGRVHLTETHRFAMIGPSELLYVMRAQGFGEIRTYNGYESRTSERLTGGRLMVSAQKPA
jgi:SAM-dependent methyltransferase